MGFRDNLKNMFKFNKNEDKSDGDEMPQDDSNATPNQYGNFRYLEELIRSGVEEIILDTDIVLGDGEEAKYQNGIRLDGSGLIIDGNGHAIDGKGKARIFQCAGNGITIKNITLKNGHADRGAAVMVLDEASCEFKSCNITGNTSTYAGAVYVSDGTLTVSDSSLNDNSSGRGAALTNYNGVVKLKNTFFSKNRSSSQKSVKNPGYGGAINNGYGEIKISDSRLSENSARFEGGAITNYRGNVTIENTVFLKNSADDCAGAINNYRGASATLTNCKFHENSSGKMGSAILNNRYAKIIVRDSSFKDNFCSKRDAVSNDESLVSETENPISVDNFKNCSAALYNDSYADAEISTITFEDSDNALGIFNSGEMKLRGAVFKSPQKAILNCGNLNLEDDGAKQLVDNHAKLTITLDENEKSFKYLDQLIRDADGSEIILQHDIKFDDNVDSEYENGIYLSCDAVIDGNGHTIDAQNCSRIFRAFRRKLELKNVTLKKGHAEEGGAMHLVNCECIIEKSCFQNNAADYGSAIYNDGGDLTISESDFTENLVNERGGAIYSENNGRIIIRNSRIWKNSAARNGGAIFNRDGRIDIHGCEFIANSSNEMGGAIYNHWHLKVSDSTFKENTSHHGGAICNSSSMDIENSSFFKNEAACAGAIDNYLGVMKVLRSKFTSNLSTEDGGAIQNYSYKDKSVVGDCNFIENSSNQSGGAIYNRSGDIELNNVDIILSKSQKGGALSNDGNVTLTGSRICANASDVGGAIFNSKNASINCFDVAFEDNFAQKEYTHDIFNDSDAKVKIRQIRFDNSQKSIMNCGHLYLCEGSSLEDKVCNRDNLIYPLNENERNFKYLYELIQNCDSHLVKLDFDIKFDAINGEEEYERGIILDDDLIIDGNGHAIDAQGIASYIFNISGGGSDFNKSEVTIKNMNLQRAQECIYNQSDVKCLVENCCIRDNRGNAIYNSGDLIIDNSKFEGNAVCIYNRNDLKVKNSDFTGNLAAKYLIYNWGLANISKSQFLKNSSGSTVIFNKDMANIESTTFKDNESESIISNSDLLSVSRGEISQNVLTESSILNNGKSCSISQTSFKSNVSQSGFADILNRSQIIINDIVIGANVKSIKNEGTLIYSSNDILDSIQNDGTLKAGIRQGEQNDFTRLNDIISNSSGNEIILNDDFAFKEYEMNFFEGGIELDEDNMVIDGQNHIIDGNGLSRIFLITGRNVILKNIHFINGRSFQNREKSRNSFGGAIRVYKNSSLILDGCKFENNESEINGGAVFNQGKLTIYYTDFLGNSSKSWAGAIHNQGVLRLYDSNFSKNFSPNHGGAINNDDGNVSIEKSSFVENFSHEGGGAINNKIGEINIVSTRFEKNKAFYGGAIMNHFAGLISIAKSSLKLNQAQHKGGAIDNWSGKVMINTSILTQNSANFGGAVLNSRTGELEIMDCKILHNMSDNVKNENQSIDVREYETEDVDEWMKELIRDAYLKK